MVLSSDCEEERMRKNLLMFFQAIPRSTLLVLTLAATAGLPAQQNPKTQAQIEAIADRILGQAMPRYQIPGMIVGIVQDGQVVVKKGYGVKRRGTADVPDENTVFAIGSVSKALTGIGAMMLVDREKVKLDDPIGAYLHGLPREWEQITVREYMTHTSGIPDFPKSPNFEVAVQRASRKPMQFRPATQQKYTNANYAIIGKMIEAVSGQPYERYMHENIFGPLEMNSTGGYREFLKGNHATGYQGEGPNQHEAEPTVTVYGIPSGGMVSTISDLLKLDAAMRAQKLMKPESYQQMYTRTIPPGVNTPWHFTPGWQARMAGKTEVVAKNGMVAGFGCQWQFVPSQGTAVIMIWNLSARNDDLWSEAAQILWQGFGIVTQQREAAMLRATPEE